LGVSEAMVTVQSANNTVGCQNANIDIACYEIAVWAHFDYTPLPMN
jgi:hypothetical protein